MDRKEEHAAALQSAQARAAKQEYILKGPPPDSWSSRMPAYCYTVLCPVPELRKVPVKRGGDANGVDQKAGYEAERL